jgi:hypothetical protein
MQSIALVFCIAVLACSCNNSSKEKNDNGTVNNPVKVIDSTLVTDSAWGAITSRTDFAGLQYIFGAANVKDERICGPECIDSLNVTFIYPETAKEITVYWADSAYHKTIAYMECYSEESPYRTPTGLKIGSTLSQLLALNGQKITFSGFDWDYGGSIYSYNNGSLEKSGVGFRLGLGTYPDNSLGGDIELNTDMPAVKKALDSIKINKLYLNFHKDPAHEH